jgi:hypothetical protein
VCNWGKFLFRLAFGAGGAGGDGWLGGIDDDDFIFLHKVLNFQVLETNK